MPLRIVIDVRRVRDFGIGTYIRSLLHALAAIDQSNDYILVALPEDQRRVLRPAAQLPNRHLPQSRLILFEPPGVPFVPASPARPAWSTFL